MTNQKYKIGEKVLVDATIIDEDNLKVEVFSHERSICHPLLIRPYTLKPEFEYGEVVEVRDYEGRGWIKVIFLNEVKGDGEAYRCMDKNVFDEFDKKRTIVRWRCCRKLQPKNELIEINGKKYDAEKVKERLADLKAEE